MAWNGRVERGSLQMGLTVLGVGTVGKVSKRMTQHRFEQTWREEKKARKAENK